MSYLEEKPDTLDSQLETWRAVVGYEGRYEVSDEGRVRSLNFRKRRGLVVVMKTATNRDGYACLSFGKKNVRVHSLVAEAFLGPRPPRYDVNHKDGNKSNNRLDNIEYCTESQNTQHSFARGLQKPISGENHYASKINDATVRLIRELSDLGVRVIEIANQLGLRPRHIEKIKNRRIWKHVK